MIKEYERARSQLIKEYLMVEKNTYHAEKLFRAISILDWAIDQDGNKETFYKYLTYVYKYLNEEIELYWENGIIRFKNIKNSREKI